MSSSALQSLNTDISSDILPSIFDWVLHYDVFQRWRQGNGSWQLHCVGGPGSGKTTLSTLVAKHLEEHPQHKYNPIIALHIDKDVPDHQIDIVEDFLAAVYRKLDEYPSFQSNRSYDAYLKYEDWCEYIPEGGRRRERLKCLREAVHTKLDAVNDTHVFLILDGLDRCGPTIRYMLEAELEAFKQKKMRILLTSRSAVFEQVEALCSHLCHEDVGDNALELYMQCHNDCNDFAMCFACKDAQRICDRCNMAGTLYEPYDHVNFRIRVPSLAMSTYVAWDLEREHGDLGLGSSAKKPPLSYLGENLLAHQDPKFVQTLVDDITAFSYENIGIARARLDLVHEAESVESLQARKDQLPPTIVALFDYGLKFIEAQPEIQREIALKAIAMAAKSGEGTTIEELRGILEMLGLPRLRSGEEIVEATRGWLVDSLRDGPQRLKIYNTNFTFYVEQRYHRAIHRSSLQIESKRRRSTAWTDLDAQQSASTARFEPQNVFGGPKKVNSFKLGRASTTATMPAIEEAPMYPFIVRKGTLAWNNS